MAAPLTNLEQTPVLGTAEYWMDRWSNGATGWRGFERDAPQLPMFENTDGLLKHANLTGLHGRSSSDFRGARVLIPLCGDTPALRFFAELGCHVTGVELVQSALDMAKSDLFPSLTFSSTTIEGLGRADSATLPLADGGSGSITLICGDIFIALERFVSDPFDIIYDRHSFGAITPDLRSRYSRSILAAMRRPSTPVRASVLGANAGLYFMQVMHRRNADFAAGPPFHVTLDEVQRHFNSDGVAEGIQWSYGSVPIFSQEEEQVLEFLCHEHGVQLGAAVVSNTLADSFQRVFHLWCFTRSHMK